MMFYSHTRHRFCRILLTLNLLVFILLHSGKPCLAISPDNLSFRHLTENDGLTNCYIYSIAQDQHGFMWFGTDNGLFRYDGFQFKQYLNVPGDTTSINSNVVFRVYTDRVNNLWVGTFMGLLRYDEDHDKFIDFNFHTLYRDGQPVPINEILESSEGNLIVASDRGLAYINPETYEFETVLAESPAFKYVGNVVTAYYIDREGAHWVATDVAIFRTDNATGAITSYKLNDFAAHKFNSTHIQQIYQDSRLNLWVTTREEGVFMKEKGSKRFGHFYYDEEDRNSLGSDETFDIYEDNENQIWISTNGGGLNLFDFDTREFTRVKQKPGDKNSLLNNNVRTFFTDKQGNLWIVSFMAGLNILINYPQQFKTYQFSNNSNFDYQSSTVNAINQYNDQTFWIGTDGGGLKLINRETDEIKTFLPDNNVPGSFPDKVVMSILKDRYGKFWFGTYQGGLALYKEKTGKFKTYQNNPKDRHSLTSDFVTCLLEDRKGNLWAGTNGGGLCLFDRENQNFRSFQFDANDPNSLVDDFVNDIIEDHNGDIWVATFWGLSRFNTDDYKFTHYLGDKTKANTLSHNSVFCLYEDSHNRLWAGTRNGLNLFRRRTGDFIYLTERDKLTGNIIYAILEDEKGFLWISTNRGLMKFNPESKTSVNFSVSDGLQGNEFFRNSAYKTDEGELFFGGINGYNSFFPKDIQPREYLPPVVITSFRIFDKEVPIGEFMEGRKILDKTINKTNELKLRYSDKIFSFHVAAIDYITPEKIEYAYLMEGFDNDWNYTNSQYPVITYTNLNPGTYKLLIKAGNSAHLENVKPSKTVVITITPPLWKTWYAYVVYMLVMLSLVYYFWRLSMQRIKQKEMIRMEVLKREKSEELNQAKLRFFTNISHEFRTPLTLIIGPLEQLLAKNRETASFRHQLDIMQKNARRMLRLVNQLLDFRKIEGGKMTLKAEKSDIVAFIDDLASSFDDYANEKSINLKFRHTINEFTMWFDPDKLDKILFNLLSNAFKFTPESGSISIELETGIRAENEEADINEFIRISVTDTGSGIPEADLPQLFDRFYQGGNKETSHKGSGLGLSLTKNLVEIHQGSITVESSSAGTKFSILLPADDSYLTEDQKNTPNTPGMNKYIHLSPETARPEQSNSAPHTEQDQIHNKPNVLLVEDNLDLRSFLAQETGQYYNLYNASDGAEGYELAIEILPDLIISDIMMSEMNGYELCRKLKQNIITSHIPVVLLTAKTGTEAEIEGYESGADAYIGKPFKVDQLVATANSIIENRMRLREKFNAGRVLSSMPIRNTADDKFLQRVRDAVDSNIGEIDFGVLELSKELGISRVHLHRKLKAIANVSPNEFIKNIRLQKASELLLIQEFTISEVCYKVGFNSPAYFSSCFKAFYKMSPSEFVEKNNLP